MVNSTCLSSTTNNSNYFFTLHFLSLPGASFQWTDSVFRPQVIFGFIYSFYYSSFLRSSLFFLFINLCFFHFTQFYFWVCIYFIALCIVLKVWSIYLKEEIFSLLNISILEISLSFLACHVIITLFPLITNTH